MMWRVVAKLMDKYLFEAVGNGRGVTLSWADARGFALTLHDVAKTVEVQAREIEGLRADAERYRTIRDDGFDVFRERIESDARVIGYRWIVDRRFHRHENESLDVALDAARQEPRHG